MATVAKIKLISNDAHAWFTTVCIAAHLIV